jgi:hypothetical protein
MSTPQDPEALPLGMEKAEKVPFRDCDGYDHNFVKFIFHYFFLPVSVAGKTNRHTATDCLCRHHTAVFLEP